jgi:hypothetical protein
MPHFAAIGEVTHGEPLPGMTAAAALTSESFGRLV